MTPEARLAAAIAARRDALVEHLCELEWAADPRDPTALVRDHDRVRPRVETFVDTLLAGLSTGDWTRFETTIGARTVDLLAIGRISAEQLNRRALALTTHLLAPVLAEPDPAELLAALFGAMQSLSGRIMGAYNEKLLAESQQLDDLKTMFMRIAGHELRAPLGTIRGYASMLSDGDMGELAPVQREAIGSMSLAAASALGIIDRLSEIARLESRGEAIHRQRHPLAQVVEGAVEPLRGAARQKGVELRIEAGPGEATVDAEEMGIAIRNLVGNALKYASDGKVITVTAARQGSDAVFEVSDRGRGIVDAERDQVFERYFRSSSSRDSSIPGSGLGLYIVRRIAELHGGEATAGDNPEGGARFRLRVPAEAPEGRSIGAEGQS